MKFRIKALSALVAVGVMGLAGAASAAVVGGGATLPEGLYGKAKAPTHGLGILHQGAGFNPYVGVGSGSGKTAFFNNDSSKLVWDHDGNPATPNVPFYSPAVNVDYAGSDSLVSTTELGNYNNPSNAKGRSSYGALIQVPSVLTSVTVPYNVPGFNGSLNLTSEQLAMVIADPAVVNWNDSDLAIPNAPDAPIKVVYRTDGSGTTEIFLRHLHAINPTLVSQVSNSFSGTIDVSSAKYIGANGSDGVVKALAENSDAITYMSPDKVEFGNPAKVASINGLLPTAVNVQAAVEEVPVPTGGQINNPIAWGISNPSPSVGYPIVASTNLIFSQCYADSGDKQKILNFFDQHYAGNNATEISQHGFVQLPAEWRNAVKNTFGTGGALQVGATNLCNGVPGRPQ